MLGHAVTPFPVKCFKDANYLGNIEVEKRKYYAFGQKTLSTLGDKNIYPYAIYLISLDCKTNDVIPTKLM